MSLGKGRPEVKPMERLTKVFSNTKKQFDSMKQRMRSNLLYDGKCLIITKSLQVILDSHFNTLQKIIV